MAPLEFQLMDPNEPPRPDQPQYGPPQYPPPPKKRRGCMWAGIIALVVLVLGTLGFCAAVGQGIDDATKESHTVLYEVTGDGPKVDITYSSDGAGSISQNSGAKPPWKQSVTVTGVFNSYTLSAQNGMGSKGGVVSCKITLDGKVVKQSTSRGAGAIASCSHAG